jgi:hypothetical protein
VVRGGLPAFFLTDSNVTKAPALAKVEETDPDAIQAEQPAAHPAAVTVEQDENNAEAFEAMNKVLRAAVQVVSAPQIFPTPATRREPRAG